MDSTEAGYAALRRGDLTEAVTHLARATSEDPTNVRAWKGLVQGNRVLGHHNEVLEAFNAVIAYTNDRQDAIDAYLSKARILEEEMGLPKQARDHYERVLQFDHTLRYPYLALSVIDLRAGKWNVAMAHADHGLEQAGPDTPERPWMLVVRAVAQRRCSLSVGPVSTFFKQLGTTGPDDPGMFALEQAYELMPALRDLLPADPFANATRTAERVHEHMPRFAIPTYRL